MLSYLGFLLFSFAGRIGRRDFWIGLLLSGILEAAGNAIGTALDRSLRLHPLMTGAGEWSNIGPIQATLTLGLLVWLSAVPAKRLHDRNRSATWLLAWFLPVINLFVLIDLGLFPGTDGANDWGDDPRSPAVTPAPPARVDGTLTGELTRLKQLLDNGTLNADEFQMLKSKAIGGLGQLAIGERPLDALHAPPIEARTIAAQSTLDHQIVPRR